MERTGRVCTACLAVDGLGRDRERARRRIPTCPLEAWFDKLLRSVRKRKPEHLQSTFPSRLPTTVSCCNAAMRHHHLSSSRSNFDEWKEKERRTMRSQMAPGGGDAAGEAVSLNRDWACICCTTPPTSEQGVSFRDIR
jgi:hypothetical protein